MIPRGSPDIGWRDLGLGLLECCRPGAARPSPPDTLACLSVRSAFDLALQALALPAGSEILFSAVNIPDMFAIAEHHGLRPVALDVDPATLAVDPAAVERALTPQSRALVAAHLFGSRMPLEPLIALARRHGLIVIEDCAQAYAGATERGHPGCDLSLFSFGPIKTATALGGAIVRGRDPALIAAMARIQAGYPAQSRRAFASRALRFAGLKVLARPWLYAGFVRLCRRAGTDHDAVITTSLRGFAGGALIERIRRRPAWPLARLLARRLGQDHGPRLARRMALAAEIGRYLPASVRIGAEAASHTHWVVPVRSRDPAGLVALLWRHGFDASQKASSMAVLGGRDGAAPEAGRMLEQIVYLPTYPGMRPADCRRLGALVAAFESGPPIG